MSEILPGQMPDVPNQELRSPDEIQKSDQLVETWNRSFGIPSMDGLARVIGSTIATFPPAALTDVPSKIAADLAIDEKNKQRYRFAAVMSFDIGDNWRMQLGETVIDQQKSQCLTGIFQVLRDKQIPIAVKMTASGTAFFLDRTRLHEIFDYKPKFEDRVAIHWKQAMNLYLQSFLARPDSQQGETEQNAAKDSESIAQRAEIWSHALQAYCQEISRIRNERIQGLLTHMESLMQNVHGNFNDVVPDISGDDDGDMKPV